MQHLVRPAGETSEGRLRSPMRQQGYVYRRSTHEVTPYCSTLNPLERFWRHFKEQLGANKLYPDIAALLAAIEKQIALLEDHLENYPDNIVENR